MPRTALTVQPAPTGYDTDGSALAWTAADVINKNEFVATGKEMILARNTHATDPYGVTITSVADAYGRTKDIVVAAIAAGVTKMFGPMPLHGWSNAGKIELEATDASVKFAIVRLP